MNKQLVTKDWSTICRKIPLVCGLKTLNAELTIYACLQQAYKIFDHVIIKATICLMYFFKKITVGFSIPPMSKRHINSNFKPIK